jgi:hypothetical protein
MNKHNNPGDNKIVLPKLSDSYKTQLSRNINFQKANDVYLTRIDQLEKPWGSTTSFEVLQ